MAQPTCFRYDDRGFDRKVIGSEGFFWKNDRRENLKRANGLEIVQGNRSVVMLKKEGGVKAYEQTVREVPQVEVKRYPWRRAGSMGVVTGLGIGLFLGLRWGMMQMGWVPYVMPMGIGVAVLGVLGLMVGVRLSSSKRIVHQLMGYGSGGLRPIERDEAVLPEGVPSGAEGFVKHLRAEGVDDRIIAFLVTRYNTTIVSLTDEGHHTSLLGSNEDAPFCCSAIRAQDLENIPYTRIRIDGDQVIIEQRTMLYVKQKQSNKEIGRIYVHAEATFRLKDDVAGKGFKDLVDSDSCLGIEYVESNVEWRVEGDVVKDKEKMRFLRGEILKGGYKASSSRGDHLVPRKTILRMARQAESSPQAARMPADAVRAGARGAGAVPVAARGPSSAPAAPAASPPPATAADSARDAIRVAPTTGRDRAGSWRGPAMRSLDGPSPRGRSKSVGCRSGAQSFGSR